MAKIETPEQAAEVLREAKFDDRDDWIFQAPLPDESFVISFAGLPVLLPNRFAIYLAQGIVDARELASLRSAALPVVELIKDCLETNSWERFLDERDCAALVGAYEGKSE